MMLIDVETKMSEFDKDDFFNMDGTLIHSWRPRYGRNVLAVNTWMYGGHRFADLREWHPDDDGKFHPTRRGVRFREEELREFRLAARLLREYLKKK